MKPPEETPGLFSQIAKCRTNGMLSSVNCSEPYHHVTLQTIIVPQNTVTSVKSTAIGRLMFCVS
jgi:hypothetical protein